ncbi:unnamed protein product [Auanema sp. JU1783]|nr:unnamed protein product [Auanema sp. JU1783]
MPGVELSCITSINYDSWTEEEKSPIKLDSFVDNYGIFKKLEKKQVEGNYSVQKDSKGLNLLNIQTNQIVKVVRKYKKCPHYLEDNRSVINIIALGTNTGVFVDSSNSVWSFDSTGNETCIDAKHVYSFCNDRVVKIAPGRSHFLILLKCKTTERKRTCSFGTEKSQLNYDFCEQCKSADKSEHELAQLMIDADQKAEQSIENEKPPTPVESLKEQLSERSALTSISEDLFLEKPWDVVSYKDRSFSQSNPNELDFSFVSLDRISIWDKIDLADNSSSGEFSENSDSKEDGNELSWLEVWSYGDNECGQLGHGDTVTRSDPVRIVSLVDRTVVDIAAGTNFSAALTAAGEIYVWGKHISSDGSDNILVPRLQKLGLDQFAFDVTTTVNALWILLNGPRTSVTLYRIGEIRGGYTTTRVKLQKDQLPIKICSTGSEVHMLKLLPHSRLKELLTIHFDIAKTAKMIRGVLDILGKIKNCTEDMYLAMMTDNCSSLLALYQEFSTQMQYTVQIVQDSKASKNITDVLVKFSTPKFISRLNKAITDCAISVASGYLHSLTYPSDIKLRIDRLATEYSEDSAQPAKVLVKLFHRIILWLKHLELYGQELASISRVSLF